MFENPWATTGTRGRPEPARIRAARVVFGAGILRARLFRGLTQLELEERSGLDQTVISRLERGRFVNVRLTRLLALLAALEVEDVMLLPGRSPGVASSVDDMLDQGRWAEANARARETRDAALAALAQSPS